MNAKEKLKLIGHMLSSTDSSPSDLSRIANYVDSFPDKAAEAVRSEPRENGDLSDKIFSNSGSWCKKVDREGVFNNTGSWCKKLDRDSIFNNVGSWCKKVDRTEMFSNMGSWCKKLDRDSIFHNVGSWCKKLDRNDVFKNNGSWCKKVDGLPSSSTAVND